MSNNNDEIIININKPKKRGRKPKIKDVNVEDTVKTPKKRGRKPKIPVISDDKKVDIKGNQNVILHLNILEEKLKQEIIPKETNIVYHEYNKHNENNEVDEVSLENKIIVPKNENLKYQEYIDLRNHIINNNKQLFIEFSHHNKTKKWPSKTNIDCLWCSHSFDSEPVGLPIKKFNHILYMFGNFCSPECAAAYNFNMNDENIWDRYSLLNEIYSTDKPINIANSKLLLTKFGGIYSINEYRIKNINNKYALNMYPIISYIPKLEEITLNINTKPIGNNVVNNTTSYNLKRENNILNNKNRLENIMNLKYI